MTLLLALLPVLFAAVPDGSEDQVVAEAVSIDGGAVPTVVPNPSPGLTSVLAPELVPDGGQQLDGTDQPVVVPETLSVYNVDIPAEAAITAGSFGLYLMVDILIKPTLQGDVSCRQPVGNGRCNPDDLSSFDRYAVGKNSAEWRLFGDVALTASLVLPAIYLGLESVVLPTQHPLRDWAQDMLVITESLALSAAMDTVLKFAFRRPRPSRYLPEAGSAPFDAELSLPSGHTLMVSAATTALTTTLFLRHPDSKVRFVVMGAGILLSGLTAFSRVESGQHFPTDVITGVLLGGFAGFAVPYLHRKESRFRPAVAFNPTTGATMFSVSGAL